MQKTMTTVAKVYTFLMQHSYGRLMTVAQIKKEMPVKMGFRLNEGQIEGALSNLRRKGAVHRLGGIGPRGGHGYEIKRPDAY